MFSEQTLSANLAALQRAQGRCPLMGALDGKSIRAVEDPSIGIRLEIRRADGNWVALSGPDPVDAGRRLVTSLQSAAQAIVVGPGLGYVLDAFEEARTATKVLALEPDPGVAALLLARRDWQRWFDSGRLRVLTGPHYEGASSAGLFLDGTARTVIVTNPVLEAHRPDTVARAHAIAKRVVHEAESNASARRKFAGPYLLQTLANLPVIAREGNAAALDGAFRGQPAVVVGAGPSLDENLEALTACQDRAVIIGADTTLRPLLAGGVRPHIIGGVDPSELNATHIAGVTDTDGIWLAAEGSLHPDVFREFRGRTFVFKVSEHEPWPWLRQLGVARGTLRAWGSVVTSAFDLAVRMGCTPIVFAGMDLAFTRMQPYCRNTIYQGMWESYVNAHCTWEQIMEAYFRDKPDVRVPDLRGDEVRTTPTLIAFRDWIVEQTSAAPRHAFINATGGGILHGGRVSQSTLREALGDAPALPDIRDRLRHLHASSCQGQVNLRPALRSAAKAPKWGIESELIQRWVRFSAGTLDGDQIRATLRSLRDM